MATQHQESGGLLLSLISALFGVGLLGPSIHLAARDDFLAKLFLSGGGFADYGYLTLLVLGFGSGIVLIARHLAEEGVAENFYEHTPY